MSHIVWTWMKSAIFGIIGLRTENPTGSWLALAGNSAMNLSCFQRLTDGSTYLGKAS